MQKEAEEMACYMQEESSAEGARRAMAERIAARKAELAGKKAAEESSMPKFEGNELMN